jgi:ribosomal protein S18 acetylase RimI-like enzyme
METDIIKKILILEELDNLIIVDFIDWEKAGGRLSELANFYNENFPQTQHSLSFKKQKYSLPDTTILVALINDKVVGLLESWISENGERLLSTILIDQRYRQQGLFKSLFDDFVKRVKENEIVIHFREENKDKLEKIYSSVGFTNSELVGQYNNGENKYKMIYNKQYR